MLPRSREALKAPNIMERNQRTLHPKQLDGQAPTRAIEHDTFHNDAHSIRTKTNVKPDLYSEAETLKSFAGDVAIERNTPVRAQVLDVLLRHLVSNVIRLPNRERDNRQRGIFRCAGCELTAVRNE
jgi:hypothetical protein